MKLSLNATRHRFPIVKRYNQVVSGYPAAGVVKHYLNLTNGIEALPTLMNRGVNPSDIGYVRIQSSQCESFDLNWILAHLDYTFLMHLAQGHVCLMYDYGSRGINVQDHRNGVPRAFWMGIQWIRYVLNYYWKLEPRTDMMYIKGYNSIQQFENKRREMPEAWKKKLKYFRPYINTTSVKMYPIFARTVNDGKKEFYASTLNSYSPTIENFTLSNTFKVPESTQKILTLDDIRAMRSVDLEPLIQRHFVPNDMFLFTHTDNEDQVLRGGVNVKTSVEN